MAGYNLPITSIFIRVGGGGGNPRNVWKVCQNQQQILCIKSETNINFRQSN